MSFRVWSVGSDDDETVPSNPDLLTQSDYTTSALSELPSLFFWSPMPSPSVNRLAYWQSAAA